MTGTPHPPTPIPADDPSRRLTISHADDADLPHVGIVGDTYTILISGDDTAGRYCLIDMLVPPGGGPAPHRHDFEELFHLLAGEIEVTFRGEATTARTGQTVNIPANAPHSFRNVSDRRGRLLCFCAPAGQDAFFLALGQRLGSRTETPTPMDDAATAAFAARAAELAPRYRTELLGP